MNIKSPSELQEAIDNLVLGDKHMCYDIARYVTYNYYMYTHIKKDSEEDLENEKIYKKFEQEHNELYNDVEKQVDFLFKRMSSDLDD
jgi:hypothetical protein